jgi:hypothetical protein
MRHMEIFLWRRKMTEDVVVLLWMRRMVFRRAWHIGVH